MNDDVEITLPPAPEGATGWDIYRTTYHPVFAELHGWRRLLARIRRRPTSYQTGTETRHHKVDTILVGDVE
jgi:hypothetical protein